MSPVCRPRHCHTEKMLRLGNIHQILLLLLAALWRPSATSRAWSGLNSSKDPNVRDWGDYSDLPAAVPQGPEQTGTTHDHGGVSGSTSWNLPLAPELDFLAEFAGKKRLWVITAPSHNNHYLRMMEKQLEDAEQAKELNCQLAERDTFILTIIQNAMMEGRIQKTTPQGEATVESLDPDTVHKLLHYLDLTDQEEGFAMLVMKKNLRVSERFPYPVRVEAILETIDQLPVRKLEKMTRRGPHSRCSPIKKKVIVTRKRQRKKIVMSSSHTRANSSSVLALKRKPALDKKTAVKSRIQEILSGHSRFVIRKVVPTKEGANGAISGGQDRGGNPSFVSRHEEDVKRDRSTIAEKKEEKKVQGVKSSKETVEADKGNNDGQEKQRSKKKDKGKKGRKGKGKKSNKDISEKDKAALKDFLDTFREKRRLMVISTPSRDATLYIQQTQENEKKECELAVRKISVASIVGRGSETTLTMQHYQHESEARQSERPWTHPGLGSLLRKELGLSSSDLFSMTVADYDMKPTRVFEAPPSSLALFEYIDNFSSRLPEREKERRSPSVCSDHKQQPAAENSLLRFMSKRRLLIISAPSEDDYSFQQQLSALSGQECHLGIRHFALLKLTGTGDKATGSVLLYPLNGRSQSEAEPLSSRGIVDLREQLKISRDYFSMLVVSKDGDVKAWFPSPIWSLDNVYDLVDSLELRLHEEKLQKRLGIHCPEDRGAEGGGVGGGAGGGYDQAGVEEYHYRRSDK